jgi:hypothetical protein
MKRHVPFFLIAFAVTFLAVRWPVRWVQRQLANPVSEGEASRILLREAQLVENFCLGSFAPMPGRTGVPAEWEKALASRIRLRDNVAEVLSDAPELAPRIDEIRNMPPGAWLFAKASSDNDTHVLVLRPSSAPRQFLVVSKTNAGFGEDPRSLPVSSLVISLLSALAAALILTLVRAALSPRS